MFQSPSLRGSGRFPDALQARIRLQHVSIPFIAGQWSLRQAGAEVQATDVRFQSPSLRGSGRFARLRDQETKLLAEVSIPFIAGQWSLRDDRRRRRIRRRVSIPFIAGQWSLPPSCTDRRRPR